MCYCLPVPPGYERQLKLPFLDAYPLEAAELRGIGRSVGKWVWDRFRPAGDGSAAYKAFVARQRRKGRGGKAVRERRAERDQTIRDLLAVGLSQREVATVVGCGKGTVTRAARSGPRPAGGGVQCAGEGWGQRATSHRAR